MIIESSDDLTGIDKFEIYFEGDLDAELITYPYEFVWDKLALFSHGLHVVAYDNAGNKTSREQFVGYSISNLLYIFSVTLKGIGI